MNKKVFILNGVANAGKDTFVNYINSLGISAVHYSYVDFTKNVLKDIGFDTDTKTDSMRKLLCDVNCALKNYADIPFKDCCSVVDDFKKDYLNGDWLFIDCREPSEIRRMTKLFNAKAVFIDRGKVTVPINSADLAATNSTNYCKYDYIIENKGNLTEFETNIRHFVADAFLGNITNDMKGNI